ncbi:hypothetical protein KCP74_00245 [Salmonella enterica subsp. enterica]|nr:hypothetical protein KCP74_00245 [Salmonella enterica subsp. enterica]
MNASARGLPPLVAQDGGYAANWMSRRRRWISQPIGLTCFGAGASFATNSAG